MGGEQARALQLVERRAVLRQNVETIGVDHHRLFRVADERENLPSAGFAQTRAERPNIDRFFQK